MKVLGRFDTKSSRQGVSSSGFYFNFNDGNYIFRYIFSPTCLFWQFLLALLGAYEGGVHELSRIWTQTFKSSDISLLSPSFPLVLVTLSISTFLSFNPYLWVFTYWFVLSWTYITFFMVSTRSCPECQGLWPKLYCQGVGHIYRPLWNRLGDDTPDGTALPPAVLWDIQVNS